MNFFRRVSAHGGQLFGKLLLAASRIKTGDTFNSAFFGTLMGATQHASYRGVELKFVVPNWLNKYRAETFATKEPETLEWIDALEKGSVLWDIGANVGLYSVYAAKQQGARVYAFEPSVFNLEALARNVFLNGLQGQVTIVPLALSNQTGGNLFRLTSTEWGGALSTFQERYGQDGEAMRPCFEYGICGVTMDIAPTLLGIPRPDYIKMDVDGIEHLILAGGQDVLSQVKGVLIEINDTFTEQSHVAVRLLEEAGLKLWKKCEVGGAEGQYNQWWARSA